MEHFLDGLKRLKLRHLREHVEDYCEMAAKRKMTNLEFLQWIVKEEVSARDETQRSVRLRMAKFPTRKHLSDFEFLFQPSIPELEIRELQTLRFIDKNENIVLLGPPGVGKTHIAISVGYEAVIKGKQVLFTTAQELIDNLYAALADGTVKQRMKSLKKLDLIIIDELGYLPMDEVAGNHLFLVISNAYERQSLIVTSNRPFQEWGTLFPSPSLAGASLDRLLHHSKVFTFRGESYRMKGGK
jgi:DNA replication protein DnaC